jgi:hypothetical protein
MLRFVPRHSVNAVVPHSSAPLNGHVIAKLDKGNADDAISAIAVPENASLS